MLDKKELKRLFSQEIKNPNRPKLTLQDQVALICSTLALFR